MPLRKQEKPGRGESLLAKVNFPADLKSFSAEEMERLATEIRARIIDTVSINGGHLASALGAVELTLALHYVFDADTDRIVWDVGHQCYAHKLVTGRRDRFDSLRKKGGLSGYPQRAESPYDAFGTGHSSTSISAALGMAVARDQQQQDHRVVALIGDGAMTGGMALEALSHAGQVGTDLLVILNDNEMSISDSVGALSAYFTRMITARAYRLSKEDVTSFVKRILGRRLSQTAHRLEQSVKGFLTAGGFFQELGFNYVGPVDGHDLPALIGLLSNVRQMDGPILLHCATQKGKGYAHAEKDPQKYHGVKPLEPKPVDDEGEARAPDKLPAKIGNGTFTDIFADALIQVGERDPRVVGITAAMPAGTGLSKFKARFPDRFFDVGICEQHAVTFAGGLAAEGMRPVCAIYSTFLQRGYDQYVHDVCLQNLPVVFAIDRAGLVGEDSPTHTGAFDLSFLRVIPNITLLAPRDGVDLRAMLHWALEQPGPVALRYPKDVAAPIGTPGDRPAMTRGEILRSGTDGTLLGVGPCLGACLAAAELLEAEGWSVGVADARRVKPLDADLLRQISDAPIITVEENALAGGFGSAVLEHFEQRGQLDDVRLRRIGLPDLFAEHATRPQQLAQLGVDADGIATATRDVLVQQVPQPVK